jgi:transposase
VIFARAPNQAAPGLWGGSSSASERFVREPEGPHGFGVIPRRWCVECTLAWLTAYRRLARDYDRAHDRQICTARP